MEMACTDDFIFVLFGPGHLFCIDRQQDGERAQAKHIWFSTSKDIKMNRLLVCHSKSRSVRLLTSCSALSWQLVVLELESRQDPLLFRMVTRDMVFPITPEEVPADALSPHIFVQDVIPVSPCMLAVIHTLAGCPKRFFTLCDLSLRVLGPPMALLDLDNHYERGGTQLVCESPVTTPATTMSAMTTGVSHIMVPTGPQGGGRRLHASAELVA
ncbi:hypothetical protein FOZ63_032289 [Perkinsus olseni]|uniref:Uncharacterized protein n=1 Tax=Perkinsus olseni TaxID=32597 RepID=A0A7J6RFV6_PEROL|nr:hypothetical protein FOZ63_032289 [Perkinsus olseni]